MPIIRSLKILRPTNPEPVPDSVVPVEEKLAIEEIVPEVKQEDPVQVEASETVQSETVEEIPEKIEPAVQAEEPPVKETEAEEASTEEASAEEKEPEEVKPKRTRKKTAKTKTDEETEEIVHVTNSLGKNQDLRDTTATVVVEYNDPAFEEFKEQLEKDLMRTNFDEQADSGIIKIILSNLSRCFDNTTREYARVNSDLEQLVNKSYGLIPRQIVMNSVGTNEVERKRNGIHAPEVYKSTQGKTVNLYALQAGLEREASYLQMVMKQLEYKRSTLIAYLTANKLEAGIGE